MTHTRTTLPGGITTSDIHSLNGLGMILPASGHYVDPLRWRAGIQGLGDLETYPGSGGSDPLLRNPIHPSLVGLGNVPSLTPGLHGLMQFDGSGGSDVLVRNPIHPSNAHAWIIGASSLGVKNKLADSLQTAPGTPAGSENGTNELTGVLDLSSIAHVFGLAGLGCADKGLGCGCGCDGRGGCGGNTVAAVSPTPATGISGLGDVGEDITNVLYSDTGLDFGWGGSLIGTIPNFVLYIGAGLLAAGVLFFSPVPHYTVQRRRNPGRKRRRARK